MKRKQKRTVRWMFGLVALVYLVVGIFIYNHYHEDMPDVLMVVAYIGAICLPFVAIIAVSKDSTPENPD